MWESSGVRRDSAVKVSVDSEKWGLWGERAKLCLSNFGWVVVILYRVWLVLSLREREGRKVGRKSILGTMLMVQ